jgi:pimeloyl-ACP methyl ester carboxylesterase
VVPRCHVEVTEPAHGNGRTLVLVHGWHHSGRHYRTTIDGRPGWAGDFAAAGFRVLTVDWPGIGQSPPVEPGVLTADVNIRGIAAVVESVPGPVDLLVHSMSGPYGVRLLETHGDRIGHLITVSPALPPALARRPDLVEDLGEVIRHVYGDLDVLTPKRAGWVRPHLSFVVDDLIGTSTRFPPVDPEAYLRTLVPMWSGLGNELLADLTRPRREPPEEPALTGRRVLVVIGTHDRNHPRASGERLAAALRDRGAECEVLARGDVGIDGNGHVPMLDTNSAEVAALLTDWLLRD